MKEWKIWIWRLLRIGFGCLLILASTDKIRHPLDFALAVENYRVLGEEASRWVAIFIPCLEALTGMFLIAGFWPDASAWINALLMMVFLVLVIQAYARKLDIHCGCFFVQGESRIGPLKILENSLYAVFSALLVNLTGTIEALRPEGKHRNFMF